MIYNQIVTWTAFAILAMFLLSNVTRETYLEEQEKCVVVVVVFDVVVVFVLK